MGLINLALNKTTLANSYVMPYSPNRAVDGSIVPTNRWLCNTLPSWLSVDLGAQYSINRWVIRHMPVAGWGTPSYCMSDFKLQASSDNINWADVDSVSGNTNIVTDRTLQTVVSCQYVRVYVTKGLNCNPQMASIMEFEVYQASASTYLTGLALSTTATPSVSVPYTPTPFNKDTTGYSASVGYDVDKIVVTPTTDISGATITVNGTGLTGGSATINLAVGTNSIPVVVTNGAATKTYTITVTRASSAYLTNLVVNNGMLTSAFVKNTLSYNATVGYDVADFTITPTAEDSNASIKVDSIGVASGQSSQKFALNVGSSVTIPVNVTSVIGNEQKAYSIVVNKPDGPYLTNLVISGVLLGFTQKNFRYSKPVGASVTSVRVTPTIADSTATITVNGQNVISGQQSNPIAINSGTNIITVQVKSAAGIILGTYIVTLTKS